MKTVIMSYSYSGNNEALATRIAENLGIEHIRITEKKKRSIGTIMADLVFGRTPKTEPKPQVISEYDLIIFAAPVWMGQPAFPIRSYLKHLKKNPKKYAYVTISGYANSGLSGNLKRRTGSESSAIVELHITDLLPSEPKPTPQAISTYKLTDEEIDKLACHAVSILKEKIIK